MAVDDQPNTHVYEKGAENEENLANELSAMESPEPEAPKLSFGQKVVRELKTPGSAIQIVIAAVVALGIGLGVTASVEDIPEAAPAILEIPGSLWLRALRATGLTSQDDNVHHMLIVCSAAFDRDCDHFGRPKP